MGNVARCQSALGASVPCSRSSEKAKCLICISRKSNMRVNLEEVPPPDRAPIDQISETLGLVPGLKAKRSSGGWRCCECSTMQPDNAWEVWVPDGVRKSDAPAVITEHCRVNAYNGEFSAWCIKCAPKSGAVVDTDMRFAFMAVLEPSPPKPKGVIATFLKWVFG